jgi:addiction module HigA family antidote
MDREIQVLKGIHPGFVLERKLREQGLKKGKLALSIMEYPQTLTNITKGTRGMNTALALKLEKVLGLEEGYFMILQAYYDIHQEKRKHATKPDTGKLRPALFWDTKMEWIDWQRQYKAVIRRVMERGNETEKAAITRFYGEEKVNLVMEAAEYT